MKKKLATLLLTGLFALSSLSTAFAGSWIQDNVGWWYQNNDGSYPTNGWARIDNLWYYFDEIGYCLIDTVTPDGFYVGPTGAWIGIPDSTDKAYENDSYNTEHAYNDATTSITFTTTEEHNWSANMPYVSGMTQNKPSNGSFWTVNVSTGKYHGNSNVENLLPENTRYYAGDAATLESNGYSRCKKRGCY